MLKYKFKAKNTENKTLRGVLVAEDEDELREIISHYNYFLISHKRVRQKSKIFGFFEKLKLDDLTSFCRQFAFMINAGIELDEAIAQLRDNTRNKKLQKILGEVYMSLLEGYTLAQALSMYPKTFPEFFVNMVAIGEASGSMEFVLRRIADYYEVDAKTKKQIKKSTFYPKMLITMIIGLLVAMSVFVMPLFTDLFMDLDAELPPLTLFVNDTTEFIRVNIFAIIGGLVGLFVFVQVAKLTKPGKRVIDYLKITLPVIRDVTINGITVRFSNGFGVLMESGAKMIDSLEIIGSLLGNQIIEDKFKIVTSEIKRGKPVAKALETVDIFPTMLIEMLKVGEESDEITAVLDKTAAYFEDQVRSSIQRVTSMIEPAFILIIGGLIATVLLSVFVPMMGVMDAIGDVADTPQP